MEVFDILKIIKILWDSSNRLEDIIFLFLDRKMNMLNYEISVHEICMFVTSLRVFALCHHRENDKDFFNNEIHLNWHSSRDKNQQFQVITKSFREFSSAILSHKIRLIRYSMEDRRRWESCKLIKLRSWLMSLVQILGKKKDRGSWELFRKEK